MRFEWVIAHAFGPLIDGQLDLAPGLNLICGPNEAGKSSWHAALYAALCGRRRGPGRPGEDRKFGERHRPWSGGEWRVATRLSLADGRVVEIHHDLEGGVDCRAIEYPTGRDVSAEIMNDGSPDGSVWLGFDRRSFLAVACVRQAEILRIRDDADSLQAQLQRAAASVAAKSTAAEAIQVIEDFRKERVGSLQAPTKPLVSTMRRLERAESKLLIAKQAHAEFLAIQEAVERQEKEALVASRGRTLVEASVADLQAAKLEERLKKAHELSKLFLSGEPNDLVDDAAIADQVTAALHDWDQKPEDAALSGESAEQIAARLHELPQIADGDREENEGVRDVAETYSMATRLLNEHRSARPTAETTPNTDGLDSQALRNLARDLEVTAASGAPLPMARTALPLRPGIVSIGIGAVLVVAGLAVLGAIVALAGALWAGYALLNRRSRPLAVTHAPDAALLYRLAAASVSAEPAVLRDLADIYDHALQAAEAVDAWTKREEVLSAKVGDARRELVTALSSRGVVLLSTEAADAAHYRYRDECRQRRQRFDLVGQLEARRTAEERNRKRSAAEDGIKTAAAVAGLDGADDKDMVVEKLRGWQRGRRQRLQQLDTARGKWTELQQALAGLTLEDLRDRTLRSRAAADALTAPFDSAEIAAVVLDDDVDRHLAALHQRETQERENLAEARQRLRSHVETAPDVAAATEELELAQSELNRLRNLDRIVERTQQFLEQAAERAHLNIAPVIQSTLRRWLPVVTCGRYVDALVNPENLEVKVRSEGGSWRGADQLSHGTSEQVYLLLRVALVEHLTRVGETCPLILDDVTAQSDVERTAAILDALAAISAEKQVIFFSQEAEVLDWARCHPEISRLVELPVLAPAR